LVEGECKVVGSTNESLQIGTRYTTRTGIVAQDVDRFVLGLDLGGGGSDRVKVLQVAGHRFDDGCCRPLHYLGLDQGVGGVRPWRGAVQQQHGLGALAGARFRHHEAGPRRAPRDGDDLSLQRWHLVGFKVREPHGGNVRVTATAAFLGGGAAHDDQQAVQYDNGSEKK
jgi:hypothetical protein